MKTGITKLELHEYFQNGCIRIKDYTSDRSRNDKYVYYGLEGECKNYSYKSIDFEGLIYCYKMRGEVRMGGSVSTMYAHTEYGLMLVEDFRENYLIELREPEYIDTLVNQFKQVGYPVEVVGENQLICVWKELK